jgi:hypothetical protein
LNGGIEREAHELIRGRGTIADLLRGRQARLLATSLVFGRVTRR